MAITRISATVVGANVISADKLANGSIVTRHIGNESVGLAQLAPAANAASIEVRLNANLDVVQDNVASISTNIDTVSDNSAAVETRRVANIQGAISSVTTADLTVSRALLSDAAGKIDFANTTAAELEFVNGVTSAIQTQLDAVEARRAANNITTTFTDDVIITGNLVINGDTTTANSINMIVEDRLMMLANSVTGSPSADVGVLFNRGNQGNAAFFYDESEQTFKVADTQDPSSNTSISPVTLSNLAVGKLSFNGADLSTAITDNRSGAISTVFATDLTASRALASDGSGKISVATTTLAELNHVNGVTGAIQTQIDAKDTVANVFNTYTRLNANLNILQDNVNTVQDNVASSVALTPFVNVITTAGSNAVGIGADTASDANVLTVTLDGVFQDNTEFVLNHSDNTLKFKDASIPSGSVVTIFSLT